MDEVLRRLMFESSECRSRVNVLGLVEEPTDAQGIELTETRAKSEDVEKRIRARLTELEDAEAAGDGDGGGTAPDAEERERLEIRGKASLAKYFAAAVHNRPIEGVEAECSEAYACPAAVPIELIRSETRDRREVRGITPIPATQATGFDAIVPALLDQSVAAFLGVDMPMVSVGDRGYPVLSTNVDGGVKAKSAASAETPGAFTVATAQPRRVTGAFRFTREDAARMDGLEDALRQNVSMVLTDAVDKQVVNGSGAGDGSINGLLAQLDDADVPAASAETFDRYLTALASHIDGLHALDEQGVRALVGAHTYRHMAVSLRSGNAADQTFSAYWRQHGGGVRATRRIADPASNIQNAIVRRANPAGDRCAVMPMWQGIELIRDPYSDAGKGEVVVTGLMLVGDVVLLRAGCFVQDAFRLA